MTSSLPDGLEPAQPAYLKLLRVRAMIFWLPLWLASIVAAIVLSERSILALLIPVVVGVIALAAIFIAPRRVYRRLGYGVDAALMRVVHGWLFHTDTVVPFVRVQHIDVTRAPLEKMFGLATLVVHTAGTHNSIVTVPGLLPERAADLRETIRGSIRADAE